MIDLLRAYERGCLRVTLNRPAQRNAVSRWPVEIRREAERGHFVRVWLDPARWMAVDDRFPPPDGATTGASGARPGGEYQVE